MGNKNNPEGSGIVHGLIVFILGTAIAIAALFGCVSLITMITSIPTVATAKGIYIASICALLFIAALAAWNGHTIAVLEKRIKALEEK